MQVIVDASIEVFMEAGMYSDNVIVLFENLWWPRTLALFEPWNIDRFL